jgi:hypothetical protein
MSSNFVRYEQNPFDDVCQRVCELDERILAVMSAEDGELVGTCLRREFPVPAKSKLSTMLLQAGIVLSIARTSEDFHGKVKCVTLRYADADEHLFPVEAESNRMMVVSTRPESVDSELIEKIAAISRMWSRYDSQVYR